MQWPDYFPENCPPETAQPALVKVYRFIDSDFPTPEDFRSWREQNPDLICPTGLTECQACGLSVFTSEEGVRIARKRIPALRKKKAAIATLTPNLGLILNTPSKRTGNTHHTWWIPVGIEPWTLFQVVNIIYSDTE